MIAQTTWFPPKTCFQDLISTCLMRGQVGEVARRHASLHTSLTDLGFKHLECMDTVNQAVHPSGVGKLVATSIQWVPAVDDCEV